MKKLTRAFGAGMMALWLCACSSSASPAASTATKLPFTDDFSKSDSGWETLKDADPVAMMAYEDGHFHIRVKQANVTQWSLAKQSLKDAVIEVDANAAPGGPTDNGYGVIFRVKDRKNFYHFEVSSDGYWRAGVVKDDKWENWSDWQQHPSIKTGSDVNHLKVEMIGDKFAFYVNGSKVGDKQDASFEAGDFGIFAQSQFGVPGVDILFDNVSVTEAKATQ